MVYAYSGFMNLFVPSAGSKWMIEAPFLIPAGEQLLQHHLTEGVSGVIEDRVQPRGRYVDLQLLVADPASDRRRFLEICFSLIQIANEGKQGARQAQRAAPSKREAEIHVAQAKEARVDMSKTHSVILGRLREEFEELDKEQAKEVAA